jgi:hypothetical protein
MTSQNSKLSLLQEYAYATTNYARFALVPFQDFQLMILQELKVIVPSLKSSNEKHAYECLFSLKRAKIYNLATAILCFLADKKNQENQNILQFHKIAWKHDQGKFEPYTYGDLFSSDDVGGSINEPILALIQNFQSFEKEFASTEKEEHDARVNGIHKMTGTNLVDAIVVYGICLLVCVGFLDLFSKSGPDILQAGDHQMTLGESTILGAQVALVKWWSMRRTATLNEFPYSKCDQTVLLASILDSKSRQQKRQLKLIRKGIRDLRSNLKTIEEQASALTLYTAIRYSVQQVAYDSHVDSGQTSRNMHLKSLLSDRTDLLTARIEYPAEANDTTLPIFNLIKTRTNDASKYLCANFTDKELSTVVAFNMPASGLYYDCFNLEAWYSLVGCVESFVVCGVRFDS